MAQKKGNKTPVTQDERFKNVHNDPRFRMPKRNDFKVEVDGRFSKADLEAIKKKSKIDKYGRKIKGDDKDAAFSKYYKNKNDKRPKKVDSDEEEEDSDSTSEADDESQDGEESEEEEEEEEEESDREDSEIEADPVVSALDRARGEGASDVDSSSDESSSDEESSDLEEESDLEEDEEGKPEETDPSNRFAVVNLDWDHVKSTDLFATFQSFVPSGGLIKSVSVYPSEFGKERLQREDIEGPPREVFKKKSKKSQESDDSDSEIEAKDLYEEGDGGEDYDSKSLRKYQLQRLRYYYAVVVCDSIKTAKNIYDNCDGTEYESTANFFDLRFIPDEMEFDEEARDSCAKVPSNYKPETFVTDALQHSKVKLTWDETPAERVKLSSKAFSQRELDDMDFKAYLASDNSDDEEDAAEDLKSKYKNLVGLSTKIGNKDIFAKEQKEEDVDMEITFTPGLDEKTAAAAEEDEDKEAKENEEESTIDRLKRKAKERRKQRKDKIKEIKQQEVEEKKAAKESKGKKGKKSKDKLDEKSKAELELLMMDEDNNDDSKSKAQHFNLKELVRSEKEKSKKSKHRNKDKIIDDDFKADLNDPRFKEIFTEHDFAIDPSQPQFKKTATMQKILDERNKRRDDEPSGSKKEKKDSRKRKLEDDQHESAYDVKSLVQKLKRKAKK